ncbi:mobilization protein [Salmonella enterica subsp. enterica serovar Enteritidis]|nr:mobilization protein [Salmonella enterica]EBQ9830544.1 mobilization protein [Salmonella enterica subsp. enterica serovar Enteritidis]EAT3826166.1 mobilization protein [Salmonella enterica]EBQ9830581.1 mobilization protein [Salmonella enterica subsp. enterica serovar Enteritidis]ECM3380663.1 mobilization protein [Salmonella enterica subsp. enterica serovar Enteritidis]
MAKAAERLAKLEEQRARINAEIQRVRAREQQQKRKEDTRRKVLVGAWILGKVESGEWPEQRLLDGLDSYLDRDHDRALFGLPPIQPQPQQQPEHVQQGQGVQEYD